MYIKLKLVFILLLTFLLTVDGNSINHDAYSNTGHEQFTYLAYDNSDYVILKDYSQAMIDNNYAKIKRIAFGWNANSVHEYEDGTYIGDIVFSRSNKTLAPLTFTYSLSEVFYEMHSYSYSGGISLKQVSKLKKVELNGAESFEIKVSSESSIKTTETNTMTITVNPNKKITLRVRGECKISLGFAKYYFIGICTKKGAFEIVDVTTSYFELYEEDA